MSSCLGRGIRRLFVIGSVVALPLYSQAPTLVAGEPVVAVGDASMVSLPITNRGSNVSSVRINSMVLASVEMVLPGGAITLGEIGRDENPPSGPRSRRKGGPSRGKPRARCH